ncbi:D-2-hydroxyacid dehydrogenase [Bacillus kwashiorkori]|uniref:D-2-hydroxyacid dehydrogenase n=1 Tax=Bacillus kwashiorkori TaxID=1522318 RepID=UPI000784F716|nr:D-2-hydroxyacid dehydrogenase [Bacillus kwashiorkori]
MHIVATFNRDEKLQNQIQQQFPNLQFHFFKNIDAAEKAVDSAEIILTFGDDITEEVVQRAKNLKWIMVFSAGLEKMPFQALKEREIIVTNVRGIHKIPMAEFTIGYMLQHAKNQATFIEQQKNKQWNRRVSMHELFGKTLLIVGAGAIGSQIAKLAKAFSMQTIGITRSGNLLENFDAVFSLADLNEQLEKADYVVNVLPSTPKTKNVFAKEQFSKMKNDAVFINIGRGDAVVEADLLEALEAGQIGHAYLDVFQQEPLPNEHPFWTCKNLTITPHISSVTEMYLPRSFEIFQHNLTTYLTNGSDFINLVDLDRGY